MTQISRPFQIALAAVFLLAAVWFFALRGHSPSGESSSSSSASASGSAASSSAPAASSSAPGGGTKASEAHAAHSSAPGVEGLTRAIDKARGAVKRSEQNAQQLAQKSAQASSSTPAEASGSAGVASSAQAQLSAAASQPTSAAKAKASPKTRSATKPRPGTSAQKLTAAPSMQAVVEGELKQGRTAIVLFWNPHGSVDVAVRGQLAQLQRTHGAGAQGKPLAVHYSSAGEVGLYGTITRSLQVFQTPTMLVISPSGKTKTLTGLADSYAIEQAIREARHS